MGLWKVLLFKDLKWRLEVAKWGFERATFTIVIKPFSDSWMHANLQFISFSNFSHFLTSRTTTVTHVAGWVPDFLDVPLAPSHQLPNWKQFKDKIKSWSRTLRTHHHLTSTYNTKYGPTNWRTLHTCSRNLTDLPILP